jgi:hypothetical protein
MLRFRQLGPPEELTAPQRDRAQIRTVQLLGGVQQSQNTVALRVIVEG